MSPQDRFASVSARLATLPAIIRTRREDAVRAERAVEDFDARVERAAVRLEKAVAELEKTVA